MAFRVQVPLRFRDLDALGHLNSSVVLTFMETARVAFSQQVLECRPWYRVPFVLAGVRCEYLAPVTEPQDLQVATWVGRIGGSSWDLEYRVDAADGTEVARGRSVQVAFDHGAGASRALGAEERGRLERWQDAPLELR